MNAATAKKRKVAKKAESTFMPKRKLTKTPLDQARTNPSRRSRPSDAALSYTEPTVEDDEEDEQQEDEEDDDDSSSSRSRTLSPSGPQTSRPLTALPPTVVAARRASSQSRAQPPRQRGSSNPRRSLEGKVEHPADQLSCNQPGGTPNNGRLPGIQLSENSRIDSQTPTEPMVEESSPNTDGNNKKAARPRGRPSLGGARGSNQYQSRRPRAESPPSTPPKSNNLAVPTLGYFTASSGSNQQLASAPAQASASVPNAGNNEIPQPAVHLPSLVRAPGRLLRFLEEKKGYVVGSGARFASVMRAAPRLGSGALPANYRPSKYNSQILIRHDDQEGGVHNANGNTRNQMRSQLSRQEERAENVMQMQGSMPIDESSSNEDESEASSPMQSQMANSPISRREGRAEDAIMKMRDQMREFQLSGQQAGAQHGNNNVRSQMVNNQHPKQQRQNENVRNANGVGLSNEQELNQARVINDHPIIQPQLNTQQTPWIKINPRSPAQPKPSHLFGPPLDFVSAVQLSKHSPGEIIHGRFDGPNSSFSIMCVDGEFGIEKSTPLFKKKIVKLNQQERTPEVEHEISQSNLILNMLNGGRNDNEVHPVSSRLSSAPGGSSSSGPNNSLSSAPGNSSSSGLSNNSSSAPGGSSSSAPNNDFLAPADSFLALDNIHPAKDNGEDCSFCQDQASFGNSNHRLWLPADASDGFCTECRDEPFQETASSFWDELEYGTSLMGEQANHLDSTATGEDPLLLGSGEPHPPKIVRKNGQDVEVSNISFCRGCNWSQLDIKLLKICGSCRTKRLGIVKHNIHNCDTSVYQLEDFPKDRRCYICPGPGEWACPGCALLTCSSCSVLLKNMCKNKLTDMFNLYEKMHVRNDAFTLRDDGGGF